MGPLIPIIALGAAGFALYKFATKRNFLAPIDVSNIPGAEKPLGPPSLIRGASGTMWLVEEVPVKISRGFTNEANFDVILNDPKIPAKPHMVIRYAISRSDPTRRLLVAQGNTVPELIQRALKDFGIGG